MGTQRADMGGGDSVTASRAMVVGWAAIFGGFDGRTDGRDGTGSLKEAAPSGKDRDLAGL
jgi:hypothetical protein